MYVPAHFAEEDKAIAAEIMAENAFGLLVINGVGKDAPFATPMPFLYRSSEGPLGTLYGHMARANPQWRGFETGAQALATFMGPHGYVSPAWYATKPAVPTWNYVTVHALGTPRLLDEPETRLMLEGLVATFEDKDSSWTMAVLSADYIRSMVKAIVAFALPIAKLETKRKLGQNRSRADSLGAAAGVRRSGNDTLATLMEKAAKPVSV